MKKFMIGYAAGLLYVIGLVMLVKAVFGVYMDGECASAWKTILVVWLISTSFGVMKGDWA